ncbi:MAG: sulfur oxidation c-type cytochrome SoxX [Pseudomonadota bacterium]|nr:MAG: sulfur oxidation c-type cytochrome SoxX [Pseudomonadota bacterium]
MRKTAQFILGTSAAIMILVAGGISPAAHAAGKLPDEKVCKDKKNPPTDAVTKGACVILDRRKGNCWGCHQIAGAPSAGNIAPPLVAMKARFPDKAKLRAQVEDPDNIKPGTVMPPFGRHAILSKQEIDDLIEFLLTL